MEGNEKTAFYCYLIASFCFLIGAVLNFFNRGTQFLAVIQLCLVAVYLYLAFIQSKK